MGVEYCDIDIAMFNMYLNKLHLYELMEHIFFMCQN